MTSGATAARAIADVTSGTILAQVEIAAPIERVFAALTRGDEIVKWWGAEQPYRTTEWTSDLRAGGAWLSRGVASDGTPFDVGGEFITVDPPREVKFTWKPSWEAGSVSTVSYRLEPIDGGTRLVLRHDGLTDPASCRNHTNGWERILGWLTGHLVAPAQPTYVMARLVPSRPDFAMTMTPAEREVMGRHVAYCKSLLDQGKGVLFGPVGDPQGPWGCGVLMVANVAEAQTLLAADPAVTSNIGARYEIMPFLNIMR